MKKVDKIVAAPHFYTMQGEGVGYIADAAMAIDGGEIKAVGRKCDIEAQYSADERIDMTHHMVMPGFIDGHMHTACNIMRGLAQDTNNWMMFGLQPFEGVVTREECNTGSYVALLEAVRAGTTTLGDFGIDMEAVCGFIDTIGARGNIAQTIRGAKRRVYKPGELYEFDDEMGRESFKRNIELFDKWHDKAGGRIKVLFGPQGIDFVSPELMGEIKAAAIERGTKVHMHVQQGDRETYQVEKRYGRRPTAFLNDGGFLGSYLIAVHLTDCDDDEARVIAKSGSTMIVNPGSIGIIDGIVCPSVVFQEAGGPCALGSDQAPGNNCHNIINEMKNVCLFNKIKYKDPEVMPAWRAVRMATIEGARAVGLGDIVGSLEPGKRADFIAIDLTAPSMSPVYTHPMRNMIPNLVYSARGPEVALSAVDGEVIMRDGHLTKIDDSELVAAMAKYPDSIGKRAEREFTEINGTNARFMKEDKL